MTTVPKPTTVGNFDTGLVNTVAIAGGHATSGFATDETFASAEANTIFNLSGQWQSWTNALATSGGTAVGQLDIGSPSAAIQSGAQFGTIAFTFDGAGVTLAATAHGLVTGTGPVQFTTTGTLPMGLSPATNYWVFATDANHFRAATSQANALAGTTINTNSAGSGTHAVVSNSTTGFPSCVLIAYRDWRQNQRGIIDQLGYPSGNFITYLENWKGTSTPPSDWTVTVTGSASATVQGPSTSTMSTRNLKLISDATNGHHAICQANPPGLTTNTSAICMEWTMSPESATHADSMLFGIGLGGAIAKYAVFEVTGTTLWAWAWKDGGSSNAGNTSVAFAATTPHWFRIEILGSTVTGLSAGTYTMRWFIDGALVGSDTFALSTSGQGWAPFFSITNTANVQTDAVDIGPVRINYVL